MTPALVIGLLLRKFKKIVLNANTHVQPIFFLQVS
jgi:hypothetical protein